MRLHVPTFRHLPPFCTTDTFVFFADLILTTHILWATNIFLLELKLDLVHFMTRHLKLLPALLTHNFLARWTAHTSLSNTVHCLRSLSLFILPLLLVADCAPAWLVSDVHSLTDTLDDFRSSSFLPMTDACGVPMLAEEANITIARHKAFLATPLWPSVVIL